jgi:phosphoribosylformimino-5-aminoimidazole carboxamide ribonucleotide (ProFAR) isomerase
MNDLQSLEDTGVAAAVVGMAIYTGMLDPRAAAEEFST